VTETFPITQTPFKNKNLENSNICYSRGFIFSGGESGINFVDPMWEDAKTLNARAASRQSIFIRLPEASFSRRIKKYP